MEHTQWKEVELQSLLEMLGLPEWVCATTQAMAAQGKCQSDVEPGKMTQAAAHKKRGRRRGKPAPEIPTVREETDPEGATPEPTEEDIAALRDLPQLSGWQTEGGPNREEFCRAQKQCPPLRD